MLCVLVWFNLITRLLFRIGQLMSKIFIKSVSFIVICEIIKFEHMWPVYDIHESNNISSWLSLVKKPMLSVCIFLWFCGYRMKLMNLIYKQKWLFLTLLLDKLRYQTIVRFNFLRHALSLPLITHCRSHPSIIYS